MARPTKLTPAVLERIVQAVKAGLTYEVAAQAAGVDRATFYRWKARGEHDQHGPYRDLCDVLKKAEAEAEAHMLGIIRDAAPTQWQAAAWFLERRYPERYGRRDRTTVELHTDYQRVADSFELDTDRLIAIAEGIARGGTDE